MKYAERVCDWLMEAGYTHCFFVAGGNIMHLLDAARTRFVCVPFVHEVSAGIATEYFNETRPHDQGRAFALVTAGPGMTNIVTALAGAFLESRELLVIGGQVKAADLSRGAVRQRGIQEVDGAAIAAPLCKVAVRMDEAISRAHFLFLVGEGSRDRPGPVFIEMCLDVQGSSESVPSDVELPSPSGDASETQAQCEWLADLVSTAERPLLLLGGGVSRSRADEIVELARGLGLPCATTWNGADRVAFDEPIYAGRPNTWGMRWANIVLQRSDLLVAAGTRLGMQQTGFNWQEFVPHGRVIQIDIDPRELEKGHPNLEAGLCADVNTALPLLLRILRNRRGSDARAQWEGWRSSIVEARESLALAEATNTHAEGFVDPFEFVQEVSGLLTPADVIIPCSSGGAFTVTMQALRNKHGQLIVTNKGLASMGYGLAGAIGASLANPSRRVVLFEGDGGFAQNFQELGTAARNRLNLKMFLFANEGYASIRMTQRNYFGGQYVGCDVETGLGLPDWPRLFDAYGIACVPLDPTDPLGSLERTEWEEQGPAAFIVPIDPEQTYYPKISSRITETGTMQSNPLHLMSPDLDPGTFAKLAPELQSNGGDKV